MSLRVPVLTHQDIEPPESLEGLGEKDRFNLLALDVSCEWVFSDRVPVTAENRAKAWRTPPGFR